jgi:hypothetical protein
MRVCPAAATVEEWCDQMTSADVSVGNNGQSSGTPPSLEQTIEDSLTGIRPGSVRALADAGRIRTMRPGETILQQG